MHVGPRKLNSSHLKFGVFALLLLYGISICINGGKIDEGGESCWYAKWEDVARNVVFTSDEFDVCSELKYEVDVSQLFKSIGYLVIN